MAVILIKPPAGGKKKINNYDDCPVKKRGQFSTHVEGKHKDQIMPQKVSLI